MRKVIFSTICMLLIFRFSIQGQSEAQISQYMFSGETYNPAIIGTHETMSLFGLHRQQWLGFPNAPQTTFFAANAPLSLFGKKHGVGLIFYNDNAGIYSDQSVNLQYAYRYKLTEGTISFGANLGFISQTIHGDSVRQIESEYHNISGDVNIPTTSVNAMSFDCSLGVFYTYKQFYAGLSVAHLLAPEFDMGDNVSSYIDRIYYLNGGYSFVLPNPRYKIKPSMLIKTNFISWQADLTAYVEKDEKYWGGLGWRLQDAIVFLLGINLSSGVSIGYSFDLATNEFISNSAGSHELFVRYDFTLGGKKTNNYKSIRIL